MTRNAALTIFAAAVAVTAPSLAPVAAVAQGSGGLTLQQMERKYPRMSPVHIAKCDFHGDGVYDRGEQACVSSIYSTMYLND